MLRFLKRRPSSGPAVLFVMLVLAAGMIVARVGLAGDQQHAAALAVTRTPPLCDATCLATKVARGRQIQAELRAGTPFVEPPLPKTIPAGIPVDHSPPQSPPWDACHTIGAFQYAPAGAGAPTVSALVAAHGIPSGCGALYFTANGQECAQWGGNGSHQPPCPPLAQLRRLVYVVVPGAATGDPRPGILTCGRPAAAPAPVCGIADGGQRRIAVPARDRDHQTVDRSAAWVFSPFPAGAKEVGVSSTAGYGTPIPRTVQDPIVDCVGTATAHWAFHILSQTYTAGCPPPWN